MIRFSVGDNRERVPGEDRFDVPSVFRHWLHAPGCDGFLHSQLRVAATRHIHSSCGVSVVLLVNYRSDSFIFSFKFPIDSFSDTLQTLNLSEHFTFPILLTDPIRSRRLSTAEVQNHEQLLAL